ncbi:MAG: 2-C-methyl-D-erythritol 2,4-cyclodiphosphate synthase [Desulfobaccales bacterium]
MKIGLGYDAHRFTEGRPLVLGGVVIRYHLGLLGHSDADVLSHAIGDAFLGAVGAGDLGRHFPDHDPAFKDISSLELLKKIMKIVRQRGYQPVNLDAVVVCEAPRLGPHFQEMIARLAPILGLPPEDLNLKATTTEKMGFTGRGEGIAAYAAVLVKKI